MNQFIQRHESVATGMLSGFDRVRFRGTLRWLSYRDGMASFLSAMGVLLKDFKTYALDITERLAETTKYLADSAGCPVTYVPSCNADKEQIVSRLPAGRRPSNELIAVLKCVESCNTYSVHRSRERKLLELQFVDARCTHYYFYLQHPVFGRMHVRLQSWFPFNVHVCINGREWLAQQLDQLGIGYRRRDNTFVALEDVRRAQLLLEAQVRIDWPARLDALLRRVHPLHAEIFAKHPIPHYWTVDQMEWATDIMFRSSQELAAVYPGLVRQAMQTFRSPDVMRFLGQKTTTAGQVSGKFEGEITSDLKIRPEGVRVKHRLGRNTVKMYDKQGSVLRIETTINDAHGLKAYRTAEGNPDAPPAWRQLRKSVVDIGRLAELSQASNTRYLDALAATAATTPLGQLTQPVCQPVHTKTRRARALNPFASDDAQLLEAVVHGEFAIQGFRNRDIRALLFGPLPTNPQDAKRQSANVTRRLGLLKSHGLIKKIQHSHRYTLTKYGQTAIIALLNARQADTEKLAKLAA